MAIATPYRWGKSAPPGSTLCPYCEVVYAGGPEDHVHKLVRGKEEVAIDADGNAYLAQPARHRILKIGAKGGVMPLCDNGQGFADGPIATARFNAPAGVAVDADHNVYVADTGNQRIRRISANGTVVTIAGDGTAGSADGLGAKARFDSPGGLAIDAHGNLLVADTNNGRIRQIVLPAP